MLVSIWSQTQTTRPWNMLPRNPDKSRLRLSAAHEETLTPLFLGRDANASNTRKTFSRASSSCKHWWLSVHIHTILDLSYWFLQLLSIIIFWQAACKPNLFFTQKAETPWGEHIIRTRTSLDNVKPEVFIAAALVFHSHKRVVEWTGIKQDRLHSNFDTIRWADCLRKLIWQEKKVSFSSGAKMMLGASAKCFTWSLRQKRIDLCCVWKHSRTRNEAGGSWSSLALFRWCITSNMVWDLLRWFSPEVLYLVRLTNYWNPNSPWVCSLYQSFGVVKVWNMKKMADIYQQDSFKRSCSGTGRLDILFSNQSGICWTTLRCQENCWTHAVFKWDKWSYWSFSENSGPGSFNLRWTLAWISCALKRCGSFGSVKDLIWNRPAFKTIR